MREIALSGPPDRAIGRRTLLPEASLGTAGVAIGFGLRRLPVAEALEQSAFCAATDGLEQTASGRTLLPEASLGTAGGAWRSASACAGREGAEALEQSAFCAAVGGLEELASGRTILPEVALARRDWAASGEVAPIARPDRAMGFGLRRL